MGLLDRIFSKGETAAVADDELFDDEFQRKLEMLAMVSRRRVAGRMRAERRTKKTGSGIEFADYREYQPGDDFRSLDWNVYQKFDKLLVRLFEEEEDLAIYFVLDTSRSMGFGEGLKFRYAKRILAALAYVGLANLDRVSIVAASSRLDGRMQETRGKARIFKVFRFLRAAKADGKTDLETALRTFAAQNKRRGLAVVFSDLYDPKGFERGLNILRYNKFDPYVVHLTDERESRPELNGDVLLYDCETGEEREVTVTAKVLERYREAWSEHLEAAERFCAGREVPYVRADVGQPEEELVLRMLRRGGFLK